MAPCVACGLPEPLLDVCKPCYDAAEVHGALHERVRIAVYLCARATAFREESMSAGNTKPSEWHGLKQEAARQCERILWAIERGEHLEGEK